MRPLKMVLSFVLLATSLVAAQQSLVVNPHLYDESADARKEIAEALQRAKKDHKRVILVYGGNWCFDCHVLDYRFHQDGIRELVEENYHVVHVDVGQYDKNLDLPVKYGATIKKGVPAISILSPTGKVLYGDITGGFEKARSMDPNDLVAFLEKWKK